MHRPTIALVCLLISLSALRAEAASYAARLHEAQTLLEKGDAAAAIERYRELQVDFPTDEAVLYGLGCAHYRHAEQIASLPPGQATPPEAVFQAAITAFESLSSAQNPRIQENAIFNRANCLAQMGRAAAKDPSAIQKAVSSLRMAIAAYEDLANRFPNNADVQQNLDHVRYLLKQLLQQTQKKEDKNEEKGDEQNEDQPNQLTGVTRISEASTDLLDSKTEIHEDTVTVFETPKGSPQP